MDLQTLHTTLAAHKKTNTYRQFLSDMVSWYPIVFYKNHGQHSIYPPNQRSCTLISTQQFEEQRENYTDYGIDYDPTQSFFEQYYSLYKKTPYPALYNYAGAENSNYAFSVYASKNCYLSFTVVKDCENIIYSFAIKEGCRNIFNSCQISNYCENVYQSSCIIQSSDVFFSRFIDNSHAIWFSSNLIGCQECIRCDSLENASYCIDNITYEKSIYEQKKKAILSDIAHYTDRYDKVSTQGKNYGSTNITGNFIQKSEDIENGNYSFNIHHGKNLLIVGSPHLNEYMYDTFEAGSLGNNHFYGAMNAGVNSEHIYNCQEIVTCSHVYYSRSMENCSFCFGCLGLKNKSFCILNKQYSKEDWYQKIEEVFHKMTKDGELGQYFPARSCPFYFNDSIAYLTDNSFTKEEVTAAGYLWRDEPIKVDIPVGAILVSTAELEQYEGFDNEGNRTINADILKVTIQDEQGNYYRIIPMEYKFLVKHGLPLPRKHWLERMKENFRINA